MGAETPSIHLIFFIVATSVSVGVAGILGGMVHSVAQGVRERSATLGEALGIDAVIINDPGNVSVNPTILYAKNIGSRIIEPSLATLLIDGKYVNATHALQSGASVWASGDVVRYTVSTEELTLVAGDHVVRLVTEAGTVDEFRFRS